MSGKHSITERVDPNLEPTERVDGWFVASLTAARVGFMAALLAPTLILLPRQVAALGEADKVANLAIVFGVGGTVGLFTALIAAALCDCTASRFGRRHPWTISGAVLTVAGFLAQSGAASLAGIVAAALLTGLGLSAMSAGLVAAIPDRVPKGQRGNDPRVRGLKDHRERERAETNQMKDEVRHVTVSPLFPPPRPIR